MSNVKEIFADKKFPTWITGHNVFKKFKEINKIFPEIGLPNCEKEIEIDNGKEAAAAAKHMVLSLHQTIDHRINTIKKYSLKHSDAVGPKRQKKLDGIIKLLGDVKTQLGKSTDKCITNANGKFTLNLPTDIMGDDNKPTFKNGEGLFRVYGKLNESLRAGHFLAMEKLEDIAAFKEFSSKNVPALKYKIKFSSDGSEGAWDIATMSMRGINSCQSWGSGNHTHVVGSIVDPFTGIIYLTSGAKFNDYGSKMIRRCVVRFIVNEKKGAPSIALEHMYPEMQKSTLDSFISFIKERTDNKFDVIYLPNGRSGYAPVSAYVPMSNIVKSLDPVNQPYRDSGIEYKADRLNPKTRIKEEVHGKLEKIYSSFPAKIVAVSRAMKLADIPEASKAAFKSLRGSDYMWDKSYELYHALETEIRHFFQKIQLDNYSDSGAYLKDGIEGFLADNLEEKLFAICKDVCAKNISKKIGKIDDETLRTLSKLGTEKVKLYLESELKKIKVVEVKPGEVSPTDAIIPIYRKLLG